MRFGNTGSKWIKKISRAVTRVAECSIHIDPDRQGFQHKIAINFLSISLNICFGCSKDVSFEYPQHIFLLRNKKTDFLLHSLIH